MNKRFLGVLAVAVVVSLLASLAVYRLISRQLSSFTKTTMVRAVVATKDLAVGSLIGEKDVKLAQVSAPVPSNVAAAPAMVIGRGVIANIYANEPVILDRLAPEGAGAGLAATIPKGMRAVAVRVDDVVSLAGFTLPGTRVDVVVSGALPGRRNDASGTISRTILQNVEVLSAGQNIEKDAQGKPVAVKVVNLLVSPKQAEMLSLAARETKIQLVLRNTLDTEEVKTEGITEASLFSDAPSKPRPAVRPASPATAAAKSAAPPKPPLIVPVLVELIHAGKKDEIKVGERKEGSPESEDLK